MENIKTDKNILIVINSSNNKATDACDELKEWLTANNIKHIVADGWKIANTVEEACNQGLSSDFDLAVVMGGDGTMLRTAGYLFDKNIPILGLNYGHLGFLTNSPNEGVVKLVADALNDKLKKEHRCKLRIHVESDKNSYDYVALNELSVNRNNSGRIVDVALSVNGIDICKLRSDGIISATATGSTAYALAAGGPLMAPSFAGQIIVAVSPHTLNSRPLIVDKNDIVELNFENDKQPSTLSINIDGVLCRTEGALKRIRTSSEDKGVTLLRFNDENFYNRISSVFFKS